MTRAQQPARTALWTQQRKAALAIAAEWRIPGMDADDVRQEALVALWVASGKHDPARGPWAAFARLAVKSRMRDLLQAATRGKRAAVVVELDPERDQAPVREGCGLPELVAAMHVLSGRERAAVAAHLNGGPVNDNALYRARRKLRSAA